MAERALGGRYDLEAVEGRAAEVVDVLERADHAVVLRADRAVVAVDVERHAGEHRGVEVDGLGVGRGDVREDLEEVGPRGGCLP
ncbi:MAG: hypothetical protein U0326_29695 [Polyangiales bacterium]